MVMNPMVDFFHSAASKSDDLCTHAYVHKFKSCVSSSSVVNLRLVEFVALLAARHDATKGVIALEHSSPPPLHSVEVGESCLVRIDSSLSGVLQLDVAQHTVRSSTN